GAGPQQGQLPQLGTYRGPSGEPELFGDLGVAPVDDLVDLGRTRFHCVPNLGQSVLPVVDVVLDRRLRRVQDRPVPGQKGLHPVLVDECPQPIQRFHVGTKTVVRVDQGRTVSQDRVPGEQGVVGRQEVADGRGGGYGGG